MTEAERKASGVWTEWARDHLSNEFPAARDCLIVFGNRSVRLLDAAGVERGTWRVDQDFVPGLVGALATLEQPLPQWSVAGWFTDFLWSIIEAVFFVPDLIIGAIKKLFRRLS